MAKEEVKKVEKKGKLAVLEEKATSKKTSSKKETEVKKTSNKKTKGTTSKKVTAKKAEAKVAKPKTSKVKEAQPKAKKTTSKTETKAKASTAKPKKTASKTTTAKKEATSKARTTTRRATTKTSSKPKIKGTAKAMLPEYYDLPYRYNETIVKILAQTPTILFVYWDISDEDRNSLVEMHGDNFFYETRPILVVHNITKNYSFEIEINDFANSWYIRTQEPNCDYIIELGRRFNNQTSEYIYINSSNGIVSPNDHVLFEKENLGNVLFKNVKTNKLSSKDFGSLRFINDIDKLYGNIYDIYSKLYNDEVFDELKNPSSGVFYRT